MTATGQETRKPLAYHFQGEGSYGTGVCGSHGMVATSPMSVTCERCLASPQFRAALNIASRYDGASK